MNPVLSAAFDREIALAEESTAKGELETGFAHLERAHVIGQAFVVPHARAHWLMLKVELQRGQPVPAFGQVVRFVPGILGSAVGSVPVGNIGGSSVSMFKRMPITPELQNIIDGGASPDARAEPRSGGEGVEYVIGVVLALAIGLGATCIGLDRDRAFYPSVLAALLPGVRRRSRSLSRMALVAFETAGGGDLTVRSNALAIGQ
jgi:hypothetical protein